MNLQHHLQSSCYNSLSLHKRTKSWTKSKPFPKQKIFCLAKSQRHAKKDQRAILSGCSACADASTEHTFPLTPSHLHRTQRQVWHPGTFQTLTASCSWASILAVCVSTGSGTFSALNWKTKKNLKQFDLHNPACERWFSLAAGECSFHSSYDTTCSQTHSLMSF